MAIDRVFTQEYLQQSGTPSPELIERAINAGDRDDAKAWLESLEQEIQGMYYNYRGWQKSILKAFEAKADEISDSNSLRSVHVIDAIDIPEAPERTEANPDNAAAAMKLWQAEFPRLKAAMLTVVMPSGEGSAIVADVFTLHGHALKIHDGMMSRVNAMLSIFYREYGDQALQALLQEVMNPSAMDPDGSLPFKEKVEKLIFFTRLHLLPFTVSEDDEKMTFMPDPCPSGARLIQQGHYDPPRNGARVAEASALTYQQKDFPIYCCHEPAMEMSSLKATGVPVFIVDPSEQLGVTPCKVYVYKNVSDIPAQYFERLGLKRPEDLIARS